MRSHSLAFRFALLIPLTALVVAGTTFLGGARGAGAGAPDSVPAPMVTWIYWHLRVPRSLLAACVGAGLAVGGVVFQALFRNPLAEPYTLGVASGAAAGAAVGYLAGWTGMALGGFPRLMLLALGGALAAMALVYLLSRLRAGRDMARLLLGGVCVAYICSAGILLVFYFANREITNSVVRWLMGSLEARERAGLEVALVLVPVLAAAAAMHRALDLLAFGEDLAAARGVHVARVTWTCYLLVGLLTAVIVANCGPIGFVGLMVPHMGRALFGLRTLPLLFGAALLGAGFLAVCDGLARSLLPVTELPVGVLTNILGAGFFFYLLATRDVALTPE